VGVLLNAELEVRPLRSFLGRAVSWLTVAQSTSLAFLEPHFFVFIEIVVLPFHLRALRFVFLRTGVLEDVLQNWLQ